MFKVNCKDYSEMIEAYLALETVLQEEKENLSAQVEQSRQSMSGEAIETWHTGFTQVLDVGAFDEVVKQTQGIRSTMEEMLPLLCKMSELGRTFGDQLQSDEFIYPSSGGSCECRDEILEFNDICTNQITLDCEEVQTFGDCMYTLIGQMKDLCGDVVDFSDATSKIEEAHCQTKRIDNFITAFGFYVTGVRDLDESLRLDFTSLIDEDEVLSGVVYEAKLRTLTGSIQITQLEEVLEKDSHDWTQEDIEIVAKAWETAVKTRNVQVLNQILDGCQGGESGILNYDGLELLCAKTDGESKEILIALVQHQFPDLNYAECLIDIEEEEGILTITVTQDVLLEKDNVVRIIARGDGVVNISKSEICNFKLDYANDYYELAEDLLEKDETGRYKFEIIIEQDVEKASEKEKEVLSLLFNDKFAVIETAPSREAREQQFEISERLLAGIFRYECKFENRNVASNVYVDEEWREVLESHITDEAALANQMLKGLEDYQKMEGQGWYTTHKVCADVTITPQMVGVTTKCNFYRPYLDYKIKEDMFYTACRERVIYHMDTLDEDARERLKRMKYSDEQLIGLYLLSDSVIDENFIDNLLKSEYREAFQTDPDELGNDVKYLLPLYASKLYLVTDDNGNYIEFEDFLNSMLYQNPDVLKGLWHTEAYINLMAEQSGLLMQTVVDERGMKKAEADWIASMDCLWKSFYHYYYSDMNIRLINFEGDDLWYSKGETLLQIKNLDITSSKDISFVLMLCNQEYREDSEDFMVYKETDFKSNIVRTPSMTEQEATAQKFRTLDEKIEMLWQQQTIGTSLELLSLFYPDYVEPIQDLLEKMDQDIADSFMKMTNSEVLEQLQSNTLEASCKTVTGFMGYFDERKSLEKEKGRIASDAMLSWFCSGYTYEAGGQKVYFSNSISDYDVLCAIDGWNEEGLSSFMDLRTLGTEPLDGDTLIKKINEGESYSDEEKEAMKFMVGGKPKGTKYTDITEIDGELFAESVIKLDELLTELSEPQGEIDIRVYWQSQFGEFGNSR